jgi:hypothetical protein
MAFDPELIAETRAWFAKALSDLRAAEALAARVGIGLSDVFHVYN